MSLDRWWEDLDNLRLLRSHIARIGDSSDELWRAVDEGVARRALESPLEALFLIWWKALAPSRLRICPQAECCFDDGTTYRVDFSIEPTDGGLLPNWTLIAVEMDGHSFHERTREQVRSRDHRDRRLQAAGLHVFHFSFSEFTAHPLECTKDVLALANHQLDQITIINLMPRFRILS